MKTSHIFRNIQCYLKTEKNVRSGLQPLYHSYVSQYTFAKTNKPGVNSPPHLQEIPAVEAESSGATTAVTISTHLTRSLTRQ